MPFHLHIIALAFNASLKKYERFVSFSVKIGFKEALLELQNKINISLSEKEKLRLSSTAVFSTFLFYFISQQLGYFAEQ